MIFPTPSLLAQIHHFDRHIPPSRLRSVRRQCGGPMLLRPDATVAELEQRGDTLRAEKSYLDALDYYRAALAKEPDSAPLYNKIGINELQMGRFGDARKDFERAIKSDRQFADAYNNLGVIFYLQKKYGPAIKRYENAIKLREDSASYYSNLGAAYFSKKDYVKASLAYNQALQLDPDIFDRTSHNGVLAQMSSPGGPGPFLLRAGEALCQERGDRPFATVPTPGVGRRLQGDRGCLQGLRVRRTAERSPVHRADGGPAGGDSE